MVWIFRCMIVIYHKYFVFKSSARIWIIIRKHVLLLYHWNGGFVQDVRFGDTILTQDTCWLVYTLFSSLKNIFPVHIFMYKILYNHYSFFVYIHVPFLFDLFCVFLILGEVSIVLSMLYLLNLVVCASKMSRHLKFDHG